MGDEVDICCKLRLLEQLCFMGEAGSFSIEVIIWVGLRCFFSHSLMFEDLSLLGVRKDWISGPLLATLERDCDDLATFFALSSD